jgi:CRP-like cAMP-binding protein
MASSKTFSSPDLAELAPVQHFYKGQIIAKQDAPCGSLYRIGEGQVLLSRRKGPDSEFALTLLGPGELFGEGSLRPHGLWLSTAKAVSDGWCNVIPAARVPRLAQYYPDLIVEILQLVSGRLERAHRRLDVLMRDSARERVLGMLQLLAGYHGEERETETLVEVAVTQAELASMVCLQRETVARALAELEEEGLIHRKPRRGVCLLALPKSPSIESGR